MRPEDVVGDLPGVEQAGVGIDGGLRGRVVGWQPAAADRTDEDRAEGGEDAREEGELTAAMLQGHAAAMRPRIARRRWARGPEQARDRRRARWRSCGRWRGRGR